MRLGKVKEWRGDAGLRPVTPARPPPPAVAVAAVAAAAASPLPAAPSHWAEIGNRARPAPEQRPARWPAGRLAAVEALWGPGFNGPGGAPETLRLCKPIGLSSQSTLLLLGGGLGGPAEAINSASGAWVDSFEADPELAAVAETRRKLHPGANHLAVRAWDRENPAFRQRSANHALALEAARGAAVAPVLEGLAAALRPQGQIVLTELVTDTAVPDGDREFNAWCRLENRLPDLPRAATITDALAKLRFDVRVIEDVSDRHIATTLSGWRAALREMSSGPKPTPAAAAFIVTEAELWLLRIRLMRRLGLRLLRWHAIATH